MTYVTIKLTCLTQAMCMYTMSIIDLEFIYVIRIIVTCAQSFEFDLLVGSFFFSLEGPLVKSGLTPEVTPVVEHYNLLPYVDILSDWLNR